jgi:hypothetical protein
MKKLSVFLSVILSVFLVVGATFALTVNLSVDELKDLANTENLGAITGPEIYQDLTVYGNIRFKEKTVQVNQTLATSTVTLYSEDSGTNYLLKATGTIIVLPAVEAGLQFKFTINGASANANFEIRSAEGYNIEGTLIVAGAVVDCDAEDQINFVTDGENLGDYVELYSDGSQWLIGDSGVLTASKLTCTDPA